MARRRDEHRIVFLRMVAAQLRELARDEPRIARELRQMADQIEGEASDMEADD